MVATKPLLICVVGSTAMGKTNLAIEIAKAFFTEIISADSRQFYKELNIGTAVPLNKELSSIPHHFIHDRSIFEDYNVGEFEKDALKILDKLFKKNKVVVLVGGSGLYIDAVVKGLDFFPEIPSDIRKKLNIEFEEFGIEALQKELQEIDPLYSKEVDIQNHHRLIRALEIYRATGIPYSSFLKKNKEKRFFNTLFIGLTAEREIIYTRINKRVDIMIREGLIEEAQNLHPYKNINALQTVGYKELFRYFENSITKEKAIEEIKKNTRRYAKRQGTWFRKNKKIYWFDYKTEVSEIIRFIKEKNAQ